jgi:putative ABC transport system ATP-binding protein
MTDSERTSIRRRSFGFVFQQPWLLSWQTAMENVLMGESQLGREAQARAECYFEELGIRGMEHKMPSQLSGGEKQRVCVARAMMNNPSVIFADEPTASLDHANGHLVVDLLASYRERGTVIIVTHDAEMLAGADRVLIMRDGRKVDWVSPREAGGEQGFVLPEPASG